MEEINMMWNHTHTHTQLQLLMVYWLTHTLTHTHLCSWPGPYTDWCEGSEASPSISSSCLCCLHLQAQGRRKWRYFRLPSYENTLTMVMKKNSDWHLCRQRAANVHAYTHVQPVRFQTIVCSTTVNGLLIALRTGKQSLWDRITLQLTFKLQWPCCRFCISPECVCLTKQNMYKIIYSTFHFN